MHLILKDFVSLLFPSRFKVQPRTRQKFNILANGLSAKEERRSYVWRVTALTRIEKNRLRGAAISLSFFRQNPDSRSLRVARASLVSVKEHRIFGNRRFQRFPLSSKSSFVFICQE